MAKQITVPAKIANVRTVIAFVGRELEIHKCPRDIADEISVAIDEIFSNIANYGYIDTQGEVDIVLQFNDAPRGVTLTFIDSGIPYNPLEKEDPDITLPTEERQIGGLGIYIVKKSMEEVRYRYENGHNHISFTKHY